MRLAECMLVLPNILPNAGLDFLGTISVYYRMRSQNDTFEYYKERHM